MEVVKNRSVDWLLIIASVVPFFFLARFFLVSGGTDVALLLVSPAVTLVVTRLALPGLEGIGDRLRRTSIFSADVGLGMLAVALLIPADHALLPMFLVLYCLSYVNVSALNVIYVVNRRAKRIA